MGWKRPFHAKSLIIGEDEYDIVNNRRIVMTNPRTRGTINEEQTVPDEPHPKEEEEKKGKAINLEDYIAEAATDKECDPLSFLLY